MMSVTRGIEDYVLDSPNSLTLPLTNLLKNSGRPSQLGKTFIPNLSKLRWLTAGAVWQSESYYHYLMTERSLLKSWYDILGQESVTIFNAGPDRSLNQVKLSHAIIYDDNSQKPFMSTPLFHMFRIEWGRTQKVY